MLTNNGGRAGSGPTGPASNAGVTRQQSQSLAVPTGRLAQRLFQGRWAGKLVTKRFFRRVSLRDEMANFQAKRL
jgi:hypothetical protein